MTKKDFFRILVKLFALNGLILTVFSHLPQTFSYISYADDYSIYFMLLGFLLLAFAFFVIIVWKTDSIINFLKLDKGFDDDRIDFQSFNTKGIIKLALIFIGGFLIIDYLPSFLQNTYLGFKSEVSASELLPTELTGSGMVFRKQDWIISILNLILGFVLVTNYSKISEWFDRKK